MAEIRHGQTSSSTGRNSPAPTSGSARTPSKTTGFLRQYELVEKVLAYHPDADEAALNRAYVYAVQKHGTQERASGDPYYAHPVAVAGLLADLKLDDTTIIAGLLHDTVEDTSVSLADIADLFGEDVAELVDGVTKLTKLEYKSEESKQAENFQKFILATIADVRVLLVKLADRLHNMRTLHFLTKADKRERIARETLDIFGPLARRVGLSIYASELEDRAFREAYPDARKAILLRLDELQASNEKDIERVERDLTALMDAAGISAQVLGRRKSPYSIWRKLERKNQSFSQITDIFAFRVIVKNVEDCYAALGHVHTTWACLPDRFRDYISMPKPNGYQSIHTTVNASGNKRVEIQFRTEAMHAVAERGVAAHWSYKNSTYGFDAEAAQAAGLNPSFSLQTFADLMEEGAEPVQYLENAKLEMYRDSVFTFTPKGTLVVLPAGSMPLDFAYSVHSKIGDSTIAAKINGEQRPLRTELQNGDVVEIIRGPEASAHYAFEALVNTSRARAAQRRLLKEREVTSFKQLGKGLIERGFRVSGIDPVEVNLESIAFALKQTGIDSLYESVGRDQVSVGQVISSAFPGHDFDPVARQDRVMMDDEVAPLMIAGEQLKPGTAIHVSECCSPIPGDRIVGILMKNEGIIVHSIDCPQLRHFEDRMDRWVDLAWTELAERGVVGQARINVTAINKMGVLATLCSAVAKANGNITSVATGRRSHDYIDLVFTIEIEDLKRLNQILAALRSLAVVDRADRLQES